MKRILLAVLVVALGASAAAAQSCDDTIKNRQALMKRSGDMAKLGASMIRGDTPFDMAKANQIFGAFQDKADKLPTLFPDCSKTGGNTHAAPAIWSKPDDFKAIIAKFGTDVKAAEANTKDADTFKASFQAVGKNCSGCHETFRTKLD
jgi:cytochrome c556